MIPVTCAVEGITDEPIARRLLAEAGLSVGPFVRKYGGWSRIDRRLPDWNASAERLPWLVIRDLDRDNRDVCIPALRSRLLGNSGAQSGMCFRFAVRSVEAWPLADHQGFNLDPPMVAPFLCAELPPWAAFLRRYGDPPKATLASYRSILRSQQVPPESKLDPLPISIVPPGQIASPRILNTYDPARAVDPGSRSLPF